MRHVRFSRAMVCLCALGIAGTALGDPSVVIKPATPLPPPSGTVINVVSVSQFYNAINSATSGTTIMIQPGTYTLSSVPQLNRSGVTIRGSTGNRDDVVLVGGGMNTDSGCRYGFHVNVNNITIADLTIRDVYSHGIQIRGENAVSNILIHNVKIVDAGERYIKGSTATGIISANVTIENCWFEQTKTLTNHSQDNNNYIGGIDAIGIQNWLIRDCYFKNIRGASGGGRGGIFLWGGVLDSIAERNVVIACDRGICYGNPYRTVPYHSTNGIIRNNFVVRGAGWPVELCATKNLKFYYNTIYNDNSGQDAIHVYDGVTTGLKMWYNIIRGGILWNGVTPGDTTGTIYGYTPLADWFVEPLAGDLRLTYAATAAINQGQMLAEVTDDYFANPRNGQPDIGAYEAPDSPHVASFQPVLGIVQSRTIPLDTVTITFDKAVTINSSMVSVAGSLTGSRNDFAFSYNTTTNTAILQWPAGLPNDTYIVTVSDAVMAGGSALDGEESLDNPDLPSGDGVAGGAFRGAIYRLVGDANLDRYVNLSDLQILVSTWGRSLGQAGFDWRPDFNIDNRVNVGDLQVLVANWGMSLPLAN